ncbi:MAG: alkaline phosphatase, partial [Myxococcota bacterium]
IVDQLLAAAPDVVLGGALDLFAFPDKGGDSPGAQNRAAAAAAGYHIVNDAAELAAWDPALEPQLLGLFQSSYESINPDLWQFGTTPITTRDASSSDPRLRDMVSRALDRLGSHPDGFFLLIENEHIDTFGHLSLFEPDLVRQAAPAEVVELSAAVQRVLDWVAESSSFDDTLIVVTADNECGNYSLMGSDLDQAIYGSIAHTRTPVPVWAAGPGSERLDGLCRGADIFSLLTGQLPDQRRGLAIP